MMNRNSAAGAPRGRGRGSRKTQGQGIPPASDDLPQSSGLPDAVVRHLQKYAWGEGCGEDESHHAREAAAQPPVCPGPLAQSMTGGSRPSPPAPGNTGPELHRVGMPPSRSYARYILPGLVSGAFILLGALVMFMLWWGRGWGRG